jgi:glycosyltransferase involved in cell wall biosynthesis
VLVDPEDVEAIADGMRRIASDRQLHEHLAKAGKRRAQDFSWRKCAVETLQVLERVGAQNGR